MATRIRKIYHNKLHMFHRITYGVNYMEMLHQRKRKKIKTKEKKGKNLTLKSNVLEPRPTYAGWGFLCKIR